MSKEKSEEDVAVANVPEAEVSRRLIEEHTT